MNQTIASRLISKCYCTDDGVNTRDTDTEPFTLSDIDDQGI